MMVVELQSRLWHTAASSSPSASVKLQLHFWAANGSIRANVESATSPCSMSSTSSSPLLPSSVTSSSLSLGLDYYYWPLFGNVLPLVWLYIYTVYLNTSHHSLSHHHHSFILLFIISRIISAVNFCCPCWVSVFLSLILRDIFSLFLKFHHSYRFWCV